MKLLLIHYVFFVDWYGALNPESDLHALLYHPRHWEDTFMLRNFGTRNNYLLASRGFFLLQEEFSCGKKLIFSVHSSVNCSGSYFPKTVDGMISPTIHPISKSALQISLEDYRPVSRQPILYKVFERIIYSSSWNKKRAPGLC